MYEQPGTHFPRLIMRRYGWNPMVTTAPAAVSLRYLNEIAENFLVIQHEREYAHTCWFRLTGGESDGQHKSWDTLENSAIKNARFGWHYETPCSDRRRKVLVEGNALGCGPV